MLKSNNEKLFVTASLSGVLVEVVKLKLLSSALFEELSHTEIFTKYWVEFFNPVKK